MPPLSVFQSCGTDVMYSQRCVVRHYIRFGVGYFAHDLLAMFTVFKVKRRHLQEGGNAREPIWMAFLHSKLLLVLHHLVLPLVGCG